MKTVAICQARMGSTRLPGKVMKSLGNQPLLKWTIDGVNETDLVDQVVLATSTLVADDKIAQYCQEMRINCFRGSESDVLDRFYQCAKKYKADIVLRFTCDCPFLDPAVIDQVIKLREMTNADYASNCYPPTYPDGLDTECFTFAALEAAWTEAKSQIDRDCLTQFIVRNRDRYKVVNLTNPLPGGHNEHWVCDSEDDFKFCEAIVKHIEDDCINQSYVGILNCLDKDPKLRRINSKSIRNERFYESLSEEQFGPRTFERSQGILERATRTIPLGAQTFSKSHIQFPAGNYPLFCSHGDGAYVFDVDGNRYVDLVGALHPVILGYCDPDVDRSVREQLDNGVTLSLATRLETELAETLCRLIPCAEMVKFGKTGTDVTTAAIKLARAHTGRDHIGVCGYHGWADWSICGTDRNSGILRDVKQFSHKLEYGCHLFNGWDNARVEPKDFAAIIVEPGDNPKWLERLRKFCAHYGIVLIFDEIKTGFRWDLGSAQALYEVTPDLACFGKAMANGMPISALVGKREIMSKMESPDVFYSGTFFGETLSIAAAIATIGKLEKLNVIEELTKVGIGLERSLGKLIAQHGLNDVVKLGGWYTDQSITFHGDLKDHLRSLFMAEMAQNGVLIINSITLSYAHKVPEIKRITRAFERTLRMMQLALQDGSINYAEPVKASPLRVA